MRRPMPTAERTMTPGASDNVKQRQLDRGDAIRERLRVGKGFLHECSIGRCSHVFGLLMRFT